jgi:hypothetical protein
MALTTTATARGQEPPPGSDEAEQAKTYYDLRRSNDRTTRFNADRYLTLVTLQEWSDASGKSKVMAKYVEHDPDLAWVKLQAVRVQDGKRVVKEITVPVEKLSKTCQSRVRQIDKLKEKLDPLLTGEGAPQTPGETAVEDPGAPMIDERGAEPGPPDGRQPFEAAGAGPPIPVEQSSAREAFEADPLGFAEMDLGPPPTPGNPEGMVLPGPPGPPPAEGASPGGAGQPLPDAQR